MKKLLLTVMSCLVGFIGLFGQNNLKINGYVNDATSGDAIAFASVVIQTADSTIVTGGTTNEDGSFELTSPSGNYILSVVYIGYKDAVQQLNLNSNIDLGIIKIEEDVQALAGSSVSAKRPILEQKLNKLVMNVADAVTTKGSDAKEILRKAPGVAIDKDGNVTLNGKSVAIWIDGRPSYLSGKELEMLLMSTDGSLVDKIEIMAHPSARYDAEGSGGVIDIKMKKTILQGLNGSVNMKYGGMYFDEWEQVAQGSLSLSYRGKKTNTNLTLSPSYRNNNFMIGSELTVEDLMMRQESKTFLNNSSKSAMIRLTHDWYVNDKNIFGAILSTNDYRAKGFVPFEKSYTNIYIVDQLVSKQRSQMDEKSSQDNYSVNVNYTHIFDPNLSKEITLNADYGTYDLDRLSIQLSPYFDMNGKMMDEPEPVHFRSDGTQNINIVSAKADYQQVVFGKGMLEAGLKFATTSTDNLSDREDNHNGVWEKNIPFSSDFDYKESIGAAYATIVAQLTPQWVLQGGLRAENTWAKGNWRSANSQSDTSYLNIFPTIYVGYNPNQNIRYGLSYSYRIHRPSFSQLNPQLDYYDATSSVGGNPYIHPEYNHEFSLSFGFKTWLNLVFVYQQTDNLILQEPIRDDQKGQMILWNNFGKQNILGGVVSITELEIAKWLYFNANVQAFQTRSVANDGSYDQKAFMGQTNGSLSFLMPKSWKLDIGAQASSAISWGYAHPKPWWISYAGIQKTLWDSKGTIALNINDIFRSYKNDVDMIAGGNNYQIIQRPHQQSVTLSFTYRFGNSTNNLKKRNVGTIDESSRVGGDNSIGK